MVTYVLRRELMLLRDGSNWLKVQCAWGTAPGTAFLPSPEVWDSVVPDWLRGRREEAVKTLAEFGLEVAADDQPLRPGAFGHGTDPDLAAERFGQVTTLDPVSMEEIRKNRDGQSS